MSHMDFLYLLLEDFFFNHLIIVFTKFFAQEESPHRGTSFTQLDEPWKKIMVFNMDFPLTTSWKYQDSKLFLLFYKNATRSSFIFHDEMKHPVSNKFYAHQLNLQCQVYTRILLRKLPRVISLINIQPKMIRNKSWSVDEINNKLCHSHAL